jgi:hypothetical protein
LPHCLGEQLLHLVRLRCGNGLVEYTIIHYIEYTI